MRDVKKYIEDKIRHIEHHKTRKHYREEKRDWKKVHCPRCQKSIQYIPKESWDGTLVCPHCGLRFKVPSLDGWLE